MILSKELDLSLVMMKVIDSTQHRPLSTTTSDFHLKSRSFLTVMLALFFSGLRPISPYKALPPLSPSKRMRKERIWVKPSPPKPDQLQLTTNARSLTRSEFLGNRYYHTLVKIVLARFRQGSLAKE